VDELSPPQRSNETLRLKGEKTSKPLTFLSLVTLRITTFLVQKIQTLSLDHEECLVDIFIKLT